MLSGEDHGSRIGCDAGSRDDWMNTDQLAGKACQRRLVAIAAAVATTAAAVAAATAAATATVTTATTTAATAGAGSPLTSLIDGQRTTEIGRAHV